MTPPTVAIETIAAPRPPERRRITGRVMRGGFILFATRLVMQGFVWTVSLTVIRLLKPDDYGVMLERDDCFPSDGELNAELDALTAAMDRGAARRSAEVAHVG